MKKILSTTLLGLIATSSFAANPVTDIHVDNNLVGDQASIVKTDMTYLKNASGFKFDAEFLKIMKKSSMTDADFVKALTDRVKHVTGESFDLSKTPVLMAEDVSVKYQPDVPMFTNDPKNPFNTLTGNDVKVKTKEENAPKVFTIMSNISGSVFSFGKKQNKLVAIKLNDGTLVSFESIRAGLIKVGEGLFAKELALSQDPKAEVNIINRLSTYYHEGRHSDGNGYSFLMGHQKCPNGHPMENNYACDSSLNGSYTFGAYAGKTLLSASKTLSEKDKERIQLRIADQFGRVVGLTDDRIIMYKKVLKNLEAALPELQKDPATNARAIRMATAYAKNINTMLANPTKFTIKHWDDRPEFVQILNEKKPN